MVDAVVVANESIGDAAQFQQAIPVGVVACQTRDFQTEDDADVSQGNFAGQASEPGTFVGTGSGEPEVFIDGDHLLLSSAAIIKTRVWASFNQLAMRSPRANPERLSVLDPESPRSSSMVSTCTFVVPQ